MKDEIKKIMLSSCYGMCVTDKNIKVNNIANKMFKSLIKYKGYNTLNEEEYTLLLAIDKLELSLKLLKCYLKIIEVNGKLIIEINPESDFNQYCLQTVKEILEDK